MDTPLFRPDPPDAEAVWRVAPGERVTVHLRNFFVMGYLLVPVGLAATLGTITFAGSGGHAIASFWPAAAFQVVLPIWFGVFGAIPCVVAAMIGNGIYGESPFIFLLANTIQSCLPALWFRYRRLDPRLRSARDWFGLIIVGCVVGNMLGAAEGVTETWIRSGIPEGAVSPARYLGAQYLRWFWANTAPCWLLAPLLLRAGSGIIVRGPFFCQRFWGAVDRGPQEHMRPGSWDDIPMAGKLMSLVLLVGLLPLYAVGALTVYGTLKRADTIATYVNQRYAYESRNEIERHIELLSAWGTEYDRPDYTDAMRREKLAEWRSRKGAFTSLEVTDWALIEPQVPTALLHRYRATGGTGALLFIVPVGEGAERERLRAAIRLKTLPDQALTGLVTWRNEKSPVVEAGPFAELVAVRGFLVLDDDGYVLYSRGPEELTGWVPPEASFEGRPRVIEQGEKAWHVAEAVMDYPSMRIFTITSASEGRRKALAQMPNILALVSILAIFSCLIVGTAMSRHLSGRVLEIAERVSEAGGTPGELEVPVRGRDEVGYLAGTLNRMSRDLETYVRKLQVTTAEKERLVQEMSLARQVQQSILPKRPPGVPGYDLAGTCLPTYEVGGDFFDMFPMPNGCVFLMIGDAVGKGLKAAMLTTEVHGIARAGALDGLAPDRVLAVTNHAILFGQETVGDFVTMFCAQLDPRTHRLSYASAGHNPPVWVHGGKVDALEIGGLPLAIRDDGTYPLHEVALEPGDCVAMYTDGATEAVNVDQEMFTTDRLEAIVRQYYTRSAQDLVDALVAEVRTFAGKAAQSDDLTLLAVSRNAHQV